MDDKVMELLGKILENQSEMNSQLKEVNTSPVSAQYSIWVVG